MERITFRRKYEIINLFLIIKLFFLFPDSPKFFGYKKGYLGIILQKNEIKLMKWKKESGLKYIVILYNLVNAYYN